MSKKLTSLGAAVLAMALAASGAKAQILTDGSFESSTVTDTGAGFTGIAPGWTNIGSNQTNSGIQNALGPSGGAAEDGNMFAFEQSGDDGAYQLTGTHVNVGDVLTLTYYAVDSWAGATQAVSLLSAPTASSSFASSLMLATDTDALPGGNTSGPYQQFTLSYTVGAGQAGFVGVSLVTHDSGGGNNGGSFAQYDNFVLTNTPATPEPSTYALLLVGVGAFLFVRRFRASSV